MDNTILKKNIVVFIFYSLLLFINKNNILGFIAIIAGCAGYFIDKRISLLLLFIWIYLVFRTTNESFQTAPIGNATNNATNNAAPIDNDVTAVNDANMDNMAKVDKVDGVGSSTFNIYIKIQNDKQTYQMKVNKNNTFKDILPRMETKLGKIGELTDYIFGLNLVNDTNDSLTYLLNDTESSLIIQRWNINATAENELAKKKVSLPSNDNTIDKNRKKYIHRNKFNLPIIADSVIITLYKRTNIDRLVFIFKNLTLLSDKNEIIDILLRENITKPEELVKFNIQKYSSTNTDDIERINYKDIENILAFARLFPIYGFTDLRIIELIKKNPNIISLTKEGIIQNLNNNLDILMPMEKIGLDYYTKKLIIHKKYYTLLNVIKINELFAIDDMYEFSINETNYNVEDIKEINYICILFIINNVLTNNEIIDTTDSWVLKAIIRTSKNYGKYFSVNDEILNKYDIKQRFTTKLYEKKLALNTKLNLDFDLIDLSRTLADNKEYKNKLYETEINKQKSIEYHKLADMNKNINIYEQQKNQNPEIIEIGKIETEFANVSLDIMNDITSLFAPKSDEQFSNFTTGEEEEQRPDGYLESSSNAELISRYLFYFKEMVKILTKDGRMFYEGLVLLIIAILLFFIESSK